MSENTTRELGPVLLAISELGAELLSMRADFTTRFQVLEIRLDALEKRTTPLQALLEELVRGQRELRSDLREVKVSLARLHVDHETRLARLEEQMESHNV